MAKDYHQEPPMSWRPMPDLAAAIKRFKLKGGNWNRAMNMALAPMFGIDPRRVEEWCRPGNEENEE